MDVRIFKYPLKLVDMQLVYMPLGAKILSVDVQNEIICLWAMVDVKGANQSRVFAIYGTGQPITDDVNKLTFIGTVQMGVYVWHVFEVLQ